MTAPISMRKLCIAAIVAGLGLSAVPATAAPIAVWTFPSLQGTPPPGAPYNPTTVDPGLDAGHPMGVTANNLSIVEISNPTPNYASQPVLRVTPSAATTQATAVSNNSYFQFSISAAAGNVINLDELVFDAARGGSGTRGFVLRSSVDGFTGDILAADVATQRPTFTNFIVPLTGASFDGLNAVTFRLYIYTGGTGASLEFDNISINGAVVPVPEPAAVALFGVVLPAGLVMLARRRTAARVAA